MKFLRRGVIKNENTKCNRKDSCTGISRWENDSARIYDDLQRFKQNKMTRLFMGAIIQTIALFENLT